MLKIRRSRDCLIFNMESPYLERRSLYCDGPKIFQICNRPSRTEFFGRKHISISFYAVQSIPSWKQDVFYLLNRHPIFWRHQSISSHGIDLCLSEYSSYASAEGIQLNAYASTLLRTGCYARAAFVNLATRKTRAVGNTASGKADHIICKWKAQYTRSMKTPSRLNHCQKKVNGHSYIRTNPSRL